MNNSTLCELVESFHDQLLSGDQRELFEQHIPHCQDCQSELAILGRLDNQLATAWHSVSLPVNADRKQGSLPVIPEAGSEQGRAPFPILQMSAVLLTVAAILVFAIVNLPFGNRSIDRSDGQPVVAGSSSGTGQFVAAVPPPTPVEIIDDKPVFASMIPRQSTFVASVESTPSMTVYSVIPKTTYSTSKKEQ